MIYREQLDRATAQRARNRARSEASDSETKRQAVGPASTNPKQNLLKSKMSKLTESLNQLVTESKTRVTQENIKIQQALAKQQREDGQTIALAQQAVKLTLSAIVALSLFIQPVHASFTCNCGGPETTIGGSGR